jgi:hypothetical protein
MTAAVSLPARTDAHPAWCVQHSGVGCIGQAVTVPGSRLTVWLAAGTASDPRLVIDGPGGWYEVPVQP